LKCERGSALGVAVCAGLAAPRPARLAAELEEENDRADSNVEDHAGDHVGDHVRMSGVQAYRGCRRSGRGCPCCQGPGGTDHGQACQGWVTHTKA
jgi:hypothetical protein